MDEGEKPQESMPETDIEIGALEGLQESKPNIEIKNQESTSNLDTEIEVDKNPQES